ncbi:histidine kinase [Kitasatospora sp. NPDC097643]|uniref:sensor histidine kinase n=1 Tax=Kitasatospora sp. NPDC097643 TaxID=3157230 RepID=UPI00332B1ECF
MVTEQTAPRAGRRRWLRSTRVQDAALALAVIVPEAFFFGSPVSPDTTWQEELQLLAFALPEVAALLFRRRWPVAAFGVVWAAAVGANLLTVFTDFHFTPYFGVLVALYTVARQCRLPAALGALALALVPIGLAIWDTVAQLAAPGYETPALIAGLAFYLPITAATWGIGRWTRAVALAAAHDRRELARARRAVVHERTQIARELHDIVANAVAVMVLQAETARTAPDPVPAGSSLPSSLPSAPSPATEALARIEEVGRSAMAELRRLLRLLRTADATVGATVEGCAGRRGLGDLAPLLEHVRQAGIQVDLEVHGTPVHLDDSVDLTAYRLVQEAVTNITKHAGPGSHAVVRVTWSDALHLDVVDDGAGRRSRARGELSTGHGLIGLAERIALFGGELSASPYRSGFRVSATLPLAPGVTTAGAPTVPATAPAAPERAG